MAYDSFTSSGLVNTALIATGAAAPTAIMPTPKAIRSGKLLIISSQASQPVELFLNWPQNAGATAPVAGDTGNFWVHPNSFIVIPLSDVGRLLSPQIYARVALASIGTLTVNIVY